MTDDQEHTITESRHMTLDQQRAFDAPLIGRPGERLHAWSLPPWAFALSFNR